MYSRLNNVLKRIKYSLRSHSECLMQILGMNTFSNFAIIVRLNLECNVIHKNIITHATECVDWHSNSKDSF